MGKLNSLDLISSRWGFWQKKMIVYANSGKECMMGMAGL